MLFAGRISIRALGVDMHSYIFALKYPRGHAANADGIQQGYLFFIESAVKLDSLQAGQNVEVTVMHGSTPAAPTCMVHSDGSATGHLDRIVIQSEPITLTLTREELKTNPIPFSTTFEGEACDTAIHYEYIDD